MMLYAENDERSWVPWASDGVKAKAKAKDLTSKAKDKVIHRDQGLRQGHDEPTQYYFLWRKYLPVTNSVY